MLTASAVVTSPVAVRLSAIRRHLGPYLDTLESNVCVSRTLPANSPLVLEAVHIVPGVMLEENVAYLPPLPGMTVGEVAGDSYALLRTGAFVRLSVRGWWESTPEGFGYSLRFDVHEDEDAAARLNMEAVARSVAAALGRARAPLSVARAAYMLEGL